jgi:hypothetical protein
MNNVPLSRLALQSRSPWAFTFLLFAPVPTFPSAFLPSKKPSSSFCQCLLRQSSSRGPWSPWTHLSHTSSRLLFLFPFLLYLISVFANLYIKFCLCISRVLIFIVQKWENAGKQEKKCLLSFDSICHLLEKATVYEDTLEQFILSSFLFTYF